MNDNVVGFRVPSLPGFLNEPRTIDHAGEIPTLGSRAKATDAVTATSTALLFRQDEPRPDVRLRSTGAFEHLGAWRIPHQEGLELRRLKPWLPVVAQPTIVPRIGELIPASSWGSSLANLMSHRDWEALRRREFVRTSGRCQLCGSARQSELHEEWRYEDPARTSTFGKQVLERLIVVCQPCHHTHHLGLAQSRGFLSAAQNRMARLNRLTLKESNIVVGALFARYEARSKVFWDLDVTVAALPAIKLRVGWSTVHDSFLSPRGGAPISIAGLAIAA